MLNYKQSESKSKQLKNMHTTCCFDSTNNSLGNKHLVKSTSTSTSVETISTLITSTSTLT